MKTNLLKSIFISLILLVGATSAWGKTVNGPRIYFDNSSMNMTSTQVYFVVGHNSYSRTYGPMKEINDTKLLYRDISTETYYNWGDATYVGFIQVGSKWGDGSWGSSNLKNATNYTAANTSWNSLDWQNTYYCKATSKGGTLSIDYKSAGYNGIPKYNATQSAKVRNTTSGSYSTVTSGDWPATLKLKGTYLSGDGASGRSEISSTKSSDGSDKKVYGAVVTGLITHSYSNLSDDYQFDGWIKGSGTSLTSTNSTYSYNITAATTVYACFTKKYAVTFGTPGNGSITATAGGNSITSGNKIVGGSEIIFTASPSAGYRIQGWYSDANCQTSLGNGTDPTYTITSLTEAKTIYVKYEEIPEEKFAVTIQPNNANYGTVSPSGLQQVGASGIEIEATAKYGYKFDQWTKTESGVTIEDPSNPTTVIKATGTGTVTATFVEDLATTKWYISGNGNGSGNDLTPGSPFTGWATNGIQMFKKSGHSTEEIYYCTITANTIASSDEHFPFKIYNATTDKYWGNDGFWVTKENNHPTLSSNSGDNMKFRPYLTGTYEFKLDATNASSPVLTVTWPVYNQLRISAANPADATNTGNFDMTGSGTYTVTRSLNANTTYTFKIVYDSEWYGANSGNFTRASSSKKLSTSSNDLTIKTDFAGNYTFTFNSSTKNLTVTYPTAYTLTYGSGAGGSGTVTADNSIKSGDLVLAGTSVSLTATPASGYDFAAW